MNRSSAMLRRGVRHAADYLVAPARGLFVAKVIFHLSASFGFVLPSSALTTPYRECREGGIPK